MSPWDGASRWINTLLLVVVGIIGFDTLFRLLEANESNVIVAFTRNGAEFLLRPFDGMFAGDEYLLTALIAILAYSLVAGVALAVVRALQASVRRRQAAGVHSEPVRGDPGGDEARGVDDQDSTPRDDPPRPDGNGSASSGHNGSPRPSTEPTERWSTGPLTERRR